MIQMEQSVLQMVAQNVSHTLFSHQIRYLQRFAERCGILESAHQFSFRHNTAEVPSFTLRTALSAIPFISDLCGVDVQ